MSRYASKIEAVAAKRKALGSFGDLGPGPLATGEWAALGLELPDVPAMRAWRLARVRAQLAARDYAAILVADPIYVRYATDSTNMQVWCLHNPVRYAFVATDGPVVVFDFHGSAHLSGHLDLVDEVRPGRGWYFFNSGPRVAEHAAAWAAEIADLISAHGGGNRRLAIDRADREGIAALQALGVGVHDGQEVMELARTVKSPDEIKAMRCALATTDAAMRAMQAHLAPGVTEQALWADLHHENIARGGECVGLCDEYPAIYYPEDAKETGYDGIFEANMTICLESYVGEAGGPEGVKLEEQALVTDTGVELLSGYPFEDRLCD